MHATVLFVDDDRALLDALQRSLRGVPYRLLTAGDARQALDLVETEPVDVLVADDQMPGMSGVELVTQVRQRFPDVVSLMLSGNTSIGSLVHAINDGEVFRFLLKPCLAQDVDRAVQAAIAHKRVMDQCRRLLPLMRRQSALVSALERKNPGICRELQDQIPTNITLAPDDFRGVDELADRLAVEIQRAETTLLRSDPGAIAGATTVRCSG